MPVKKIAVAYYIARNGQVYDRGEEVDLHEDEIARGESLGAFEGSTPVDPAAGVIEQALSGPVRQTTDVDADTAGENSTADEPAPAEGNLSSLSKDELKALAEEAGLDSSGTKADIIERLSA